MIHKTHLPGYPFANAYKRLQVFKFGYLSNLFLINCKDELRLATS